MFKNTICGVARQDFIVDWEIAIGDGTLPDLVIAFALSVKVTAVCPENSFHFGREVCHLVVERYYMFAVGN